MTDTDYIPDNQEIADAARVIADGGPGDPNSVTERGRAELAEAQLAEQARTFSAEIDRLSAELTAAREEIAERTRQMDRIGQALLEEAERRDWCSEFDTFAASFDWLPKRRRDWIVTFRYTGTAQARIRASDEDDAAERLTDMTSYDLQRHLITSRIGDMEDVEVDSVDL